MTSNRIGYRRGEGAPDLPVRREWLVTNGLGGYASGTLAGTITRRYHGLLVAALPNPLGRTMMFNQLIEWVSGKGDATVPLGGGSNTDALAEFRVEQGLPVWVYDVQGIRIEKRLMLPSGQNSVCVTYRLIEGPPGLTLHLRPALQVRPHDAPVSTRTPVYTLALSEDRFEIIPGGEFPPLRMYVYGDHTGFVFEPSTSSPVDYSIEAARGYESHGTLWSRGRFDITLEVNKPVALMASVESWDVMAALDPDELTLCESRRRRAMVRRVKDAEETAVVADLVLGADQFIIAPVGRPVSVAASIAPSSTRRPSASSGECAASTRSSSRRPSVNISSTSTPAGIFSPAACCQVATGSDQAWTSNVHAPPASGVTQAS